MIDVPSEQVFDTVADYSTWTKWSPWLGIDKEAVVTVSDDPRSVNSLYNWTGDLVGQGEIEHLKLDRPDRVDDEIRFIKPFRSKSNVSFELTKAADSTKITWRMQGNLP